MLTLMLTTGLTGCVPPVPQAGAPATPADMPTAAGKAATIGLRVTRIADGDTFTGKDATGASVKVRMLAIDAPELAHNRNPAGCGAKQAAARLQQLLSGKQVSIVADPKSDPVDRFGRRLGYVEIAGRDIGLQLATEGMVEAWYPSGEPRPVRYQTYADAAHTAQRHRTGSWASCPKLGR